ncbi:MAG: hypothetical protein ACHQFX_02385 [Chitinophagales bacterium]
MKKVIGILAFTFIASISFSQTTMKQYTVGHPFYISLPEYMNKTAGINGDASIQYKNEVKDVFGFVIEDNKEILKMAEMNYSSITEFYEDFIKGFIEGEEQVKQSQPISLKKGDINFIEADVSYFDKNAQAEIYYLVGIVETKKAYYKVLSYCSLSNKAKFKEDFKKILYSLKD